VGLFPPLMRIENMAKLTKENRAALQSARAKNRKMVVILGALGADGVKIPKAVIASIKSLEVYFGKALAPKAKAAPKAETATDEAVAA
jgi:hypothetical protein